MKNTCIVVMLCGVMLSLCTVAGNANATLLGSFSSNLEYCFHPYDPPPFVVDLVDDYQNPNMVANLFFGPVGTDNILTSGIDFANAVSVLTNKGKSGDILVSPAPYHSEQYGPNVNVFPNLYGYKIDSIETSVAPPYVWWVDGFQTFLGIEVSVDIYGEKLPDAPPIPEPSTFILIGAGIIGLIGLRRKKHQAN